jgi:hypothetical protein
MVAPMGSTERIVSVRDRLSTICARPAIGTAPPVRLLLPHCGTMAMLRWAQSRTMAAT